MGEIKKVIDIFGFFVLNITFPFATIQLKSPYNVSLCLVHNTFNTTF
ncbi:hypothetical protein D1BOALGB6SA_939 [Olavius sp. associated proteobacterium Delta 1]|nr:hypothetical protein D1BOALGB6SA_939 [Olavius sp. associated proteobacterium Delta 1]